MSYYRFQLWGMLVRGSGSRELHILYSHLLSRSKDLAMGVCNGGERYNFDKFISSILEKLVM